MRRVSERIGKDVEKNMCKDVCECNKYRNGG
jgi:hypothetical protein